MQIVEFFQPGLQLVENEGKFAVEAKLLFLLSIAGVIGMRPAVNRHLGNVRGIQMLR